MLDPFSERSEELPEQCPKCGSRKIVPIAYGFPSGTTVEKGKRREIILGGCMIDLDSPRYGCLDCQKKDWEAIGLPEDA
jgi:hypothetical protein